MQESSKQKTTPNTALTIINKLKTQQTNRNFVTNYYIVAILVSAKLKISESSFTY